MLPWVSVAGTGAGPLNFRVWRELSGFPVLTRRMNVSMVVLGHLTNPHDLKGSFSVHFGAEDFAGHGASAKASARTFNLSVHVGSAKPSAVHTRSDYWGTC